MIDRRWARKCGTCGELKGVEYYYVNKTGGYLRNCIKCSPHIDTIAPPLKHYEAKKARDQCE